MLLGPMTVLRLDVLRRRNDLLVIVGSSHLLVQLGADLCSAPRTFHL